MLEDFNAIARRIMKGNPGKGEDALVFGRHPQSALMKLDEGVRSGVYRPMYSSFIKRKPRPREIVYPADCERRIVGKWVGERIRPLIESQLTDRSYSGRKGRGPLNAVDRFRQDIYDVSNGYVGKAYIIRIDIRNCFPLADRGKMCERIISLIDSGYKKDDAGRLKELVRLLYLDLGKISPICDEADYELVPREKVIRGRRGTKGSPIGDALFHLGVELLLSDVDWWLSDRDIRFVRYLDDIILVTDRKDYVLSLFPELRARLRRIGFELNDKKFFCQPYQHGVKFLGMHIKYNRVYLDNRTVGKAFAEVKKRNRNVNERSLPLMISSVNSYLALLNKCSGYKVILKLVGAINDRWWEMCYYDNERGCIVAKSGYKMRDLIIRRYGLKGDRYVRLNHRIKNIPSEVDYDENDMLKWLWEDDDELKWLYDPEKGLRDKRWKLKSVKR